MDFNNIKMGGMSSESASEMFKLGVGYDKSGFRTYKHKPSLIYYDEDDDVLGV